MLKRFWKEVGKRVWIRDYKDSIYASGAYREPPPADQPAYKVPKTEASDLSNNSYMKRDVRRNYPKWSTFSQSDVANLLTTAEPVPKIEEASADKGTAVEQSTQVTRKLESVILEAKTPLYSVSNLPPTPGTNYTYRISPEQEEEQPGQYYPTYKVY